MTGKQGAVAVFVLFAGLCLPLTASAYNGCPGVKTVAAYTAANFSLPVLSLASNGTTDLNVDISAFPSVLPYAQRCDITTGATIGGGAFASFSPLFNTGGSGGSFASQAGDAFLVIFSNDPTPGGGGNTALLFFTVDAGGNIEPLSNPPVVSGVSITSNNASTTLSSGDTEGIVPFTIKLTNYFGNTGFTVSTTSDNSAITFDKTAPTLAEVAPIATSTNTTPSYSFTTTEAGTISYGGSCSSATTAAITPTTTIAFNTLAVGTHSDCTITVTDAAGNASAALAVTPFEIDAPPPAPAPAQSGGGGTITGSGPLSYGYQQPAPAAVIPQEPAPAPAPAPAQLPVTQQAQSPAQKSGLPGRVGGVEAGTGEPRTFVQGIVPSPTGTQAAAIATAPVPGFHPSPWLLVALPAVGGLWWGGRKFFGYTMRP